MAYIVCCGGLRKCRLFFLIPEDGFLEAKMYYLEECPRCGATVVQIARLDFNDQVSLFRKANKKAVLLFEKLKSVIRFEEKLKFNPRLPYSKYYLRYNEYGRTKKCYSNLNMLEMGKYDPDMGLDMVKKPFIKP